MTSSTDANNQTTTTVYGSGSTADPFYRPVESEDPLGNITYLAYTPTTTDSSFSVNGGASVIETHSVDDSLGRVTVSQRGKDHPVRTGIQGLVHLTAMGECTRSVYLV